MDRANAAVDSIGSFTPPDGAFDRTIGGARSFIGLLRLAPFDTTNPGGRSKERYRRAAISSVASLVLQSLMAVFGLVSVRLAVGHLGRELYGIWLILASVLSWISLANLGAPQGLQNSLSSALALGATDRAKSLVASAFWALGVLSLGLIALAGLLWLTVDWVALFNIPRSVDRGDLTRAVALAVVFASASLPLSCIKAVYAAHQAGYLASIWEFLRILVTIAAMFAVTHTRLGLTGWVMAIYISTLVISGLNCFWLFQKGFPAVRPSPSQVSWMSLRTLSGTSFSVFGISIGVLVISSAPALVLSHYLGPGAVPVYAVPAMVFALGRAVASNAMGSVSPAYTEAAARGDWAWVKRTHTRVRLSTALASAVFLVVVTACGPWFIELWTKGQLHCGRPLVFCIGVHSALWITFGGDGVLVSSLDRAQVLVAAVLVEMVAFVLLAVYLTPIFAETGIALASLLAFLMTNAWYCPYQAAKSIRIRRSVFPEPDPNE